MNKKMKYGLQRMVWCDTFLNIPLCMILTFRTMLTFYRLRKRIKANKNWGRPEMKYIQTEISLTI